MMSVFFLAEQAFVFIKKNIKTFLEPLGYNKCSPDYFFQVSIYIFGRSKTSDSLFGYL